MQFDVTALKMNLSTKRNNNSIANSKRTEHRCQRNCKTKQEKIEKQVTPEQEKNIFGSPLCEVEARTPGKSWQTSKLNREMLTFLSPELELHTKNKSNKSYEAGSKKIIPNYVRDLEKPLRMRSLINIQRPKIPETDSIFEELIDNRKSTGYSILGDCLSFPSDHGDIYEEPKCPGVGAH